MLSEDRCGNGLCDLASTVCMNTPDNLTCVSATNPGGDTYQGSLWASSTDTQRQCGSNLNSLSMDERIWVSEAPNLRKSFFDYNLTGLGNGISDVWYRSRLGQQVTSF